MALSIKEELDILSGTITPTDSDYDIHTLVKQVAIGEIEGFLATVKAITPEINPLAQSYKSKILSIGNSILKDAFRFRSISNVLISILGGTSTDMATVTTSDTAAWVTFIENNMLEALERIANVLPDEKTDYDAL